MPTRLTLGKYKFDTWYSPSEVLHDSSVRLWNPLSYIHTYKPSTNIPSAVAWDINLVATLRNVNTYRLELPLEMSDIHDVFHVSQLKKCLRVRDEQAPMEAMDLQPNLQSGKTDQDIRYYHPTNQEASSKILSGIIE